MPVQTPPIVVSIVVAIAIPLSGEPDHDLVGVALHHPWDHITRVSVQQEPPITVPDAHLIQPPLSPETPEVDNNFPSADSDDMLLGVVVSRVLVGVVQRVELSFLREEWDPQIRNVVRTAIIRTESVQHSHIHLQINYKIQNKL